MLSLALLSLLSTAMPDGARVVLEHGDDRVGTYVSKPWGFSTNTHWIVGPEGLVLIDTQFLVSAGEEAVAWAEDVTGKKVVLAIVLHPNPDKFNGTGFLKKRGVRVITSEQVLKAIPAVHEKRKQWFAERYKPDYPTELVLPESFGRTTQTIKAAGLELKLHVLGPGASAAHVVVEFEDHVFTGDLVTHGAHAWLELGTIEPWLERLAEIRALEPKFVHVGRGPSGGPELLVRQEAYLRDVLAVVARETPRLPRDEAAVTRAKEKIEAMYPGYRFKAFLDLGLPAVWDKRAGK